MIQSVNLYSKRKSNKRTVDKQSGYLNALLCMEGLYSIALRTLLQGKDNGQASLEEAGTLVDEEAEINFVSEELEGVDSLCKDKELKEIVSIKKVLAEAVLGLRDMKHTYNILSSPEMARIIHKKVGWLLSKIEGNRINFTNGSMGIYASHSKDADFNNDYALYVDYRQLGNEENRRFAEGTMKKYLAYLSLRAKYECCEALSN